MAAPAVLNPIPPPETILANPKQPLTSLLSTVSTSLVDKEMLKLLPEVGHLAPVILTTGALFISFITLNYPIAMLGVSGIEAMLAHYFIGKLGSYLLTPDSAGKENSCGSYFQSITPSRFRIFIGNGLGNKFPNAPLYFITFAATYCIQSLLFFSQESSELGPQYSNRPYIAIIAAAMFILLYALYLVSYGCDSIMSLFFTVLVGGFIGFLICQQNYILLGKDAVNLLFVPPLAKRSGMDYVCVTTPTASPTDST